MASTASLLSTARRAAVVAAVGAAAVSIAALSAGTAQAAVGDNLPDNCLEFSADGTTGWSTAADATINWTGNIPSPGSSVVNGTTHVRNVCDTPAKFQVYAGKWSVSGGASAYLSADLGSTNGSNVDLAPAGNYGILVAEKKIAKNTPMAVTLHVGIPRSETAQGFVIKPNWSFALEEVESSGGPIDPVDPTDPGDDCGSGSLGSGSLGSMFGSSDCKASATAKVDVADLIQVHSPAVVVR